MEMEEEEGEATGSYGRGPWRGKKRFLKSGRQEFHKPSLAAKHSAFSAAEVPFEIQLQLHLEEEGDKRNQRGRGTLNFQQKQRMEEKRQKRKRGREP